MDLIFKPSGGTNVVFRPQAQPRFVPTATTEAVWVDLYWRGINADNTRGVWHFAGRYPRASKGSIPWNPDVDQNAEVSAVPVNASGIPKFASPDDGVRATVIVARGGLKPTIGQTIPSTTDLIEIGITGQNRFDRFRKVRTSPNPDMSDDSVTIFDSSTYADKELPRYIDLSRDAALVSDFEWVGNAPVGHGFTKTGSGTTATSTSPAGWRITTSGSDAKTFYSKSSFPSTPFSAGFTLELAPPTVVASDGSSLPNESIAARVEDGSHSYDLTFDSTAVTLNGGTAHAHGGAKVRLVIAPGGATADLWIGATKVEDNTAGGSSSTTALVFGDLADGDDSEAVWSHLAYALTPQDPALAATIYVGVSHSSGGTFGTESDIGEFSFADITGGGGSDGGFDPTPRDEIPAF